MIDLVQQVGLAHDRAPVDVDDKASEIVGGRGQVGEGVPAEALVWHPDGAPVDVAELGEVQAHLFDDHLRVLNQEKIDLPPGVREMNTNMRNHSSGFQTEEEIIGLLREAENLPLRSLDGQIDDALGH